MGAPPFELSCAGRVRWQKHGHSMKGLGTENRRWICRPERPRISPVRYIIGVQENVKILTPDGVQLNCRILLPIVGSATFSLPCILLMNPYGHTLRPELELELRELVAMGYAGLHVSMRGVGGSGGSAGLYDHYDEDGFAIVEWAAAQSWCNGNIGILGPSRLGIPQWRTARAAPPHLKAIIPDVACGDCYFEHWYRGGTLPGPGREQPLLYEIALKHRNFDAFWRKRSTITEDHEKIGASGLPVMVFGGWMDYMSPGNQRAFRDYSAAGGKGKLIIGPWAHRTGSGLMPYDKLSYQALWFDHHLKGVDNGIDSEPPILIYVQGANQWRFEDAWPIPDTRFLRLYLRGVKSETVSSLNDGSLSGLAPNQAELGVSYDYDPEKGPWLPIGVSQVRGRLTINQQPFEAHALTWTSSALNAPIEITGWIKFIFWATATEGDTDFIMQISDVAPSGYSTQVTTAALNAPRYFDRINPPFLRMGEICLYQIEIEPTSWVIDTGHRIRLSIAGGCAVYIDPETSKAQQGPQGPGKNPKSSKVTIYQDAGHASHIDFPVIGAAMFPA
jgi:uncharacterized protein